MVHGLLPPYDRQKEVQSPWQHLAVLSDRRDTQIAIDPIRRSSMDWSGVYPSKASRQAQLNDASDICLLRRSVHHSLLCSRTAMHLEHNEQPSYLDLLAPLHVSQFQSP